MYVLKHDTDALLINLDDRQVFDLLPKIGIQRVDKILLNNHHRENLQGYSRVDPRILKITASPMRAEIVPLEIELDGKQYGQWFDFMVGKEPAKMALKTIGFDLQESHQLHRTLKLAIECFSVGCHHSDVVMYGKLFPLTAERQAHRIARLTPTTGTQNSFSRSILGGNRASG